MKLLLKSIENAPVTSVCHIFYDEQTKRCIIVDPGSENPVMIDNFLEEKGLHVDYIVLTHEHFDHIWSCNFLIRKYRATLLCSEYCSVAILNAKTNLSVFFEPSKAFAVEPNQTIVVGDTNRLIQWNGYELQFRDSGGHSMGGILMMTQNYIVTGDTLIKGLKTVTKLKNASLDKLIETLEYLDSMKGNDLLICPGHGECFELDNYDLTIALGKK